jgi:UDP-glucose 4-epimerase
MRILITGGSGFIGSTICRHLLDKGYDVRIIDNLSSSNESNLSDIKEKIEIIRGDIRYYNEVRKAAQDVDAIIHLAAIAVVPASITNPRETFDVNLYGTLNVLEVAKELGIQKVVFASSAAVYGNIPNDIRKETDILDPQSPYAVSKASMEYFMKMFAEQGLDTCSLRLFNVFGARQDPKYYAVIPNFITKMMQNEPVAIHGSGKQTRDFVYVKDVARAFEKAINTKTNGAVINIASGKNISVVELGEKIINISGSKSTINFEKSREGDVDKSLAEISTAKAILNWEPKYSFDDGLKETIEWFKNNANC